MSDPDPSVLRQVLWTNWRLEQVIHDLGKNVVRVQLVLMPYALHLPPINGTWISIDTVVRYAGTEGYNIMRSNSDPAVLAALDAAVAASAATDVARVKRALIQGNPRDIAMAKLPLQYTIALAKISSWNQARYHMSDRSKPDAFGNIGWIQDALARLGHYLDTDEAELFEFAKRHGLATQVNWAAPLAGPGGPRDQLKLLFLRKEQELLADRRAFDALSDAIAADPYILSVMNNQTVEATQLASALKDTSRPTGTCGRRNGAVTPNVY